MENTMRTIRFHEYGEPTDVLCLEEVAIPEPGAGTHSRESTRLRLKSG